MLTELRWKYKIKVDTELTAEEANKRGFSVRFLEGQSRRHQELFLLNQIEIRKGDLDEKVKIVVGPTTTQVYISTVDTPNLDDLESYLDILDNTEKILNHIVRRVEEENASYNEEKRSVVSTSGFLKVHQILTTSRDNAIIGLNNLILREAAKSFILVASGNFPQAKKSLDVISRRLTSFQRSLINEMRKQNPEKAIEYEEKLDRLMSTTADLEREIVRAQSPLEIKQILKRLLDEYKRLSS